MKKRMLLLGMAIWMAAALAGCGNDTTASTDQATAADQEQSENATDRDADRWITDGCEYRTGSNRCPSDPDGEAAKGLAQR